VDYNPHTILKGDAKTQVTVDLDAPSPDESLHTLLISACHKEGYTIDQVREYINELLIANEVNLAPSKVKLIINPAGTWTVGGPEADAGLTGRKIVCDQYGGYVSVGGGAFSGKDPSKVDRSAAYMARHLAVSAIYKFAEEGLRWIEIQLAYAIGVKEPVSVTFRSNYREPDKIQEVKAWLDGFDLTPSGIINYLGLTENPNYERRAEGCHYFLHMRKDEV
jgi:S-adenosylmethionine synthetase